MGRVEKKEQEPFSEHFYLRYPPELDPRSVGVTIICSAVPGKERAVSFHLHVEKGESLLSSVQNVLQLGKVVPASIPGQTVGDAVAITYLGTNKQFPSLTRSHTDLYTFTQSRGWVRQQKGVTFGRTV